MHEMEQDGRIEEQVPEQVSESEPQAQEAEQAPEPEPEKGGFWLSHRWELALYGVLLLIAGAMRFWDLGSRAMHHDESLHAVYSWYLYTGRGYEHFPMMHGPFQFHANAFIFFLFGDSDYTARLIYSLYGTA